MSQPIVCDFLRREAEESNTVYADMAPPCNSFTRARWPRIRDTQNPHGLPNLPDKAQQEVDLANRVVHNTFQLATQLVEDGVQVSVENPQTSLW